MPIKINGATSGSTTITAPATGSDESIELSTALASKLDTTAYTAPGLTLIATETYASVSAFSVDGCFSSSYENYLVLWSGLASAAGNLHMRLRASSTDASGSDYAQQNLQATATSVSASRDTGSTFVKVGVNRNTDRSSSTVSVFAPALSEVTRFITNQHDANTTSVQSAYLTATHRLSSAYDGFTLSADGGVLITGTVRIYGYKD